MIPAIFVSLMLISFSNGKPIFDPIDNSAKLWKESRSGTIDNSLSKLDKLPRIGIIDELAELEKLPHIEEFLETKKVELSRTVGLATYCWYANHDSICNVIAGIKFCTIPKAKKKVCTNVDK